MTRQVSALHIVASLSTYESRTRSTQSRRFPCRPAAKRLLCVDATDSTKLTMLYSNKPLAFKRFARQKRHRANAVTVQRWSASPRYP